MTATPDPFGTITVGPLRLVADDRGTYLVTVEGSSDVIATASPSGAGYRWHHLVSGQFGVVSRLDEAGEAILEWEQRSRR